MTHSVKIQHHCLVCGSELSGPLFEITNMPCGAQAMPSQEDLSEDRGIDLALCRCPSCGLVQFDCEPVSYYRDAIRVVGLSETMKELRRADYRHLIGHYGMARKKWLECGCSNGDFLKVLAEPEFAEKNRISLYGTENGEAGLAEARGKLCAGSTEVCIPESRLMRFFPDAGDMDIPGAPFDVFLSFNFLEHQPDPVSMLRCLHRNLAEDGIGLITVPSFEYIIQEGRYYELVRDHIANYDMDSLTALCEISGFEVLEKERIGIGDTLRVVVKKAAEKAGAAGNRELPETDADVLKENYFRMRASIAGYMGDLQRKGRSAALWGAGHQGLTIASTTAFKDHIRYIIDSSEKKQGLYGPASHLPIVAPERYLSDPVDVIIIAAPGYVKEIEKAIRMRYQDAPAGIPEICSILDF